MDHFFERRINAGYGASAELRGDGIECLDLRLRLDHVDRIRVGRIAYAEAVDGERAVALRHGGLNIAVIVVVVGEIPVPTLVLALLKTYADEDLRLVESDPVRQQLYCRSSTTIRMTKLGRDGVVSGQGLKVF